MFFDIYGAELKKLVSEKETEKMEPYFEKNLIINHREFKYKGIFRVDELFSAINRALEERGYEKREKRSEEVVTEEGRKSYIELRPFKVMSNYVTLMIKIHIELERITEITEVLKGEKKLFQQGEVTLYFDAWSLTDYKGRWGMRPWTYFLKGMINKFIYKYPTESGFTGELVGDTAVIYARIKKLFNSYKVEVGKAPSEEEIRKQVEEEIRLEIEEGEKEGMGES